MIMQGLSQMVKKRFRLAVASFVHHGAGKTHQSRYGRYLLPSLQSRIGPAITADWCQELDTRSATLCDRLMTLAGSSSLQYQQVMSTSCQELQCILEVMQAN